MSFPNSPNARGWKLGEGRLRFTPTVLTSLMGCKLPLGLARVRSCHRHLFGQASPNLWCETCQPVILGLNHKLTIAPTPKSIISGMPGVKRKPSDSHMSIISRQWGDGVGRGHRDNVPQRACKLYPHPFLLPLMWPHLHLTFSEIH